MSLWAPPTTSFYVCVTLWTNHQQTRVLTVCELILRYSRLILRCSILACQTVPVSNAITHEHENMSRLHHLNSYTVVSRPVKTLAPSVAGLANVERQIPSLENLLVRSVCVCCFVLLNRYWGIVTVPGFLHERAKGYAPTIENRRRTTSPCPPLDKCDESEHTCVV